MAVYLVVLLAMILFGLGAVLSFRSAFNISAQRRIRHSLEARYLAEAGLQRALHFLRRGHTRLNDSFDYGGGKVSFQFQPGTGPYSEPLIDVLSRGTFQELSTVLLAKVEVDPVFLMDSEADAGTTTGPAQDWIGAVGSYGTSPSTTGTGGSHVTMVKYVATVSNDPTAPMDLAKANDGFLARVRDANARYAAQLSGVSRAELRWRLFDLAVAVAHAGDQTLPEPASPPAPAAESPPKERAR
ncbi:MAG: hypothetical protein HY814_06985 [Candidatus Riflebacteria bacterium]|nr:hypothetical protein [Candidatus Riflebacteria bacterium]